MSKKEVSPSEQHCTSGLGLNISGPNEAPQTGSIIKHDSVVSKNLKSSEECSLYDSGRADSGFLSGANINSDQFLSEDLTDVSDISPKIKDSEPSNEHSGDSKSYMRLDSGVDLGLNNQFSGLNLKDDVSLNNLNTLSPKSLDSKSPTSSNINTQFVNVKPSTRTLVPSNPPSSTKLHTTYSWELYFQQDEDGDTQLHIAILKEFIEVVYSLVRMVPHPSYLDIRNDDCQTPLHLAVLTGQSRMVRRLLCGGAAADIRDRHGNTPLHLAVAAGDIACVRALTELITVAETNAAELRYPIYSIHTLVSNVRDLYNYDGLTCVHLAAINGHIEILRYLVRLGANINAREWKAGRTALHLAIERRDEQMCLYLLTDCIIDLEMETYAGLTAYQLAARIDFKLAWQLTELGADTYLGDFTDDEDEDDEMLENPFQSFKVNGGGMVNVSA